MDLPETLSSCRICLENTGEIPIFGMPNDTKNEKVISTLQSCTATEIADIPGYPRSICVQCNSLVDAAYDLINKFIKSKKILSSEISGVKQEKLNGDDDYVQEFEMEICAKFKEESESSNSDDESLLDIKNSKMFVAQQIIEKNEDSAEIALAKVKKELLKKRKKVSNIKLKKESKMKSKKLEKASKSKSKKKEEKVKTEEVVKPPEKSNLCEHCGLALKTKDSLAIHILKYHCERLYCPECPYTNHSKKNLNMHIKRNHAEKTEKCSQCGNGFAILNDLKNHIIKVHGKKKEKKMYDCQYCEAKLARPYLKVMHERTAHSEFLAGLMRR